MAEIKIAGIMRSGAFSPNHIGNDTTIFNLVADQLRKRGCIVNVYSEDQLLAGQVKENVIVDMCRKQQSIDMLQKLEDEGAIVINSGYGIENCRRERVARILMGSSFPFPKTLIVNTNENIKDELAKHGISRCWIKRADLYTVHKEDVSYARNTQEAQDVLQEYFLRGINRAVVSAHVKGDLVKFYGIAGTPFFYTYFYHLDPADNHLTGSDNQPPLLDKEKLMDTCQRAADTIGLVVYGGDCIVDADGNFTIIAFNDWPSFSPCRVEAAPKIAKRVMQIVKNHEK